MSIALSERTVRPQSWIARLPLSFLAGALMLLIAIIVALIGPMVTQDPLELNLGTTLQAPSAEHWLGTDNFGRDVLARIVSATSVDLQFGFFSVLPTLVMGTALGILAGTNRWIDAVLMRVLDLVVAFPFYLSLIHI